MTLHLVKSETPEERANSAVWDEINQRIEDAYPAFLERVKQDALAPFLTAYEDRVRRLEQQIPLLTLMQGQQMIIDLLREQLEGRKN